MTDTHENQNRRHTGESLANAGVPGVPNSAKPTNRPTPVGASNNGSGPGMTSRTNLDNDRAPAVDSATIGASESAVKRGQDSTANATVSH
jgi:hypothetical protein